MRLLNVYQDRLSFAAIFYFIYRGRFFGYCAGSLLLGCLLAVRGPASAIFIECLACTVPSARLFYIWWSLDILQFRLMTFHYPFPEVFYPRIRVCPLLRYFLLFFPWFSLLGYCAGSEVLGSSVLSNALGSFFNLRVSAVL